MTDSDNLPLARAALRRGIWCLRFVTVPRRVLRADPLAATPMPTEKQIERAVADAREARYRASRYRAAVAPDAIETKGKEIG